MTTETSVPELDPTPTFKLEERPGTKERIAVRIADLVPFADRKCACKGEGERRVSVKGELGPPMKSGRRKHVHTLKRVPCTCGLNAFMRAQKTTLDKETGQLFFAEPIRFWSDEGRRLHAASKVVEAPPDGTQATP